MEKLYQSVTTEILSIYSLGKQGKLDEAKTKALEFATVDTSKDSSELLAFLKS